MQNHMVLARLNDLRTRLDLGALPPLVHRCSSGLSREDPPLVRWNSPLVRAWYLKESFQLFWGYQQP